ncbi:MAG: sodium-translocating pyrophosphatase [Planctomycetia bacterium 21-64-5]|nr:MAG: sodium-translocating pyrophosphatase [Planctomycetia bacterium 21-64-5]HQU44587.1 sodium-translocating pyrophosphatase [Pirellulales bacterium]
MNRFRTQPASVVLLTLLALGCLAGAGWLQVGGYQAVTAMGAVEHKAIELWAPLKSPKYATYEKIALLANVGVAIAGLLYALMLVGQVKNAPQGTARMQEIARAVREGADAYLYRQFRVVGLLIGVITFVLYFAAVKSKTPAEIAIGRAIAFLVGSIFSATVGFVGMRLATIGNLRVATAAQESFGRALQLGYRTGTITGMLTDGLGLLGGSIIFLIYGEHAYEALLGFGFGGTLLALFMRVGGGIYTKGADVGADLVGKLEAGIPEDDPRNAATIADNVGDNVGDCAGMAADIFESYEVTIVAAMILGIASFGHKGVIFPLLVRAIGVIASIISTYSVRAGDKGTAAQAMKSVNRGFVIGSLISVLGFIVLGWAYLNFNQEYLDQYPQAIAGFPGHTPENVTAGLPVWATFNVAGLDMRPAWTCLVGIILAVFLNKCTEYYTGTEYSPVKSLAKACTTGHATNIIQGFAVGYESTVAAVFIIAGAILASVLIYSGTNATFVAFGVAMCGIGMLTLTGNTISMDVFGPVADNANGIGEMGYDAQAMGEKAYKESRQILADLDAVGNTTKAITKGIAIGSAVIAAVSLFNSFIVSVGSGGQGESATITEDVYAKVAALLTVSNPHLFIGMLLGGAVPFLFSSMTIRAVGRAAYLIVKECRIQFRDKEIWEGTKKPDYGRVVDICTTAAQKELVGPALLAILVPTLVGFGLGTIALAGFLAGMIVTGQLLAVFMANAGGAWDNAKKTIEDEPRNAEANTGKGSEKHKAAITGDTVGDPLKDTAGPAINPLIKVMNMVSLLIIGLILPYDKELIDRMGVAWQQTYLPDGVKPHDALFWGSIVVSAVGLAWAIWQSKHETPDMQG